MRQNAGKTMMQLQWLGYPDVLSNSMCNLMSEFASHVTEKVGKQKTKN